MDWLAPFFHTVTTPFFQFFSSRRRHYPLLPMASAAPLPCRRCPRHSSSPSTWLRPGAVPLIRMRTTNSILQYGHPNINCYLSLWCNLTTYGHPNNIWYYSSFSIQVRFDTELNLYALTHCREKGRFQYVNAFNIVIQMD